MRAPIDLIDLPFAFTQLDLLPVDKFIKEAKTRDVRLTSGILEGLHRLGLLRPLLRVSRDRRAIVRAQRQDPALAQQLGHWVSTQAWSLRDERAKGRVHDGFSERFVARARLRRTIGDCEYDASYFLYSPHQLMLLPVVAGGLSHLVWHEGRVTGIDVDPWWLEFVRARTFWAQDVVVAVSALEARYHSSVVGRLRLPSVAAFDEYDRWRERLRLGSMLRWLGVRPGWLRDTAASLLTQADSIDPLGDWD